VTNRPHFTSLQVGHDVAWQFKKDERRVMCDKMSTINQKWTKNTWMICVGVRMSHNKRFVGWTDSACQIVA
jgi:hypothetical protein